jgi:hypothetical protein
LEYFVDAPVVLVITTWNSGVVVPVSRLKTAVAVLDASEVTYGVVLELKVVALAAFVWLIAATRMAVVATRADRDKARRDPPAFACLISRLPIISVLRIKGVSLDAP